MVYVIKSVWYIEETEKVVKLLKIGYTRDDRKNIRYGTYKLHNPLCSVIYEIPDATMIDEANLHHYFKFLRYKDYGNEWFEYSDDIINYFETHKTVESLVDVSDQVYYPIPRKNTVRNSLIRKVLNYLFCIREDYPKKYNFHDILDTLYNSRNIHVLEDIVTYLDLNGYGLTEEDKKKVKYYMSDSFTNPKEVNEFLDKCESLEFPDKMRAICEDLNDEIRNLVLDQMPYKFKYLYNSAGPDRCKAAGYNITKINNYLTTITADKNKLTLDILTEFELEHRYTKSYIKEKLGKIYLNNNYKEKPKASSLSNYFNLKACLIRRDDNSGWENGLEILSKKE